MKMQFQINPYSMLTDFSFMGNYSFYNHFLSVYELKTTLFYVYLSLCGK